MKVLILLALLSSYSCNASNVEWMTPDEASSSSSSSNVDQFSCTLAAKDASSCEAATADDGSSCVWCSLSGLGFCVSDAQAKAMEKVIPTIKCGSGPTPKTDDAVHPPTVAPTANDPNSDIWDCLDKKDEVACHKTSATTKCTWCVSKVGYGLCLAPVEADFASTSKWFKCDKGDDLAEDAVAMVVEAPVTDFDTSCLVASLEQDASFCQATKDGQNENCKWCHVSSAPTLQMCLSSEQADLAEAFVSCDQQEEDSSIVASKVQDPLDMSCVEASMIQDETVCESTVDVSGQACEWCAVPRVPYHVCLSKDQVNLVSGFVECSKPPVVVSTTATSAAVSTSKEMKQKKFTTKLLRSGSSTTNKRTDLKNDQSVQDFDPSCLMASLAQDASICQATSDATGQVCEWCHATTAPSLHLCLSSEQATLATGLVSCDATNLEVEMESPVKDPTDLSCLEASLLQDESACESTSDTSGQACEYCSIPNLSFHVCLSEEQASLVAGFVTCSTGPSSAPATEQAQAAAVTTTMTKEEKVDFPPNLFKCLQLLDEGGCEKGACTWCDTQIGFGLCLPKEAAAATDNCPFFDCDGPTNSTTTTAAAMTMEVVTETKDHATFSAPDINCLAAGMGSDDAQSVCQATLDQQGSTCVWCDAAGSGFGLCLSQEEAKVAGKWLQCSGSNGNDITTAIKN